MTLNLNTTLAEVTQETLMNMAFLMPAEPSMQGGAPTATTTEVACVTACAEFLGPKAGSLWLTAPRSMIETLAINMLGLDDGEQATPDQQVDALKELVNVICGNVLPLADNPKAIYNVFSPQLWFDRRHWLPPEDKTPAARAHLTLESGEVEVGLYLG